MSHRLPLLGTATVLLLLTKVSVPAQEPPAAPPPVPAQTPTTTARATAPPPAPPAAAVQPPAQPWRTDRVMITLTDPADAEALAADFGAQLLRPPIHGGLVSLSVPEGESAQSLLSAMAGDPRVAAAQRVGTITGSAKGGKKATTSTALTTAESTTNADPCAIKGGKARVRASPLQWPLDELDTPTPDDIDLSGITIAVLDTGIAYESYTDALGSYVQAPSLSQSAFVAPWDFVSDDAHPNDDHQHGTHIASLIASVGSVEGIAPRATLMPLKVLDSSNSGAEDDLIAAIYHATDSGADIINMSLSFHPNYQPSLALQDALTYAVEAGVVMVAAAGNSGLQTVTWPAAHPHVIAVGALTDGQTSLPRPADYSNRSARVEISAPGGDLSADIDGDGVPDGIIAETISPDDPTELGLWAYAGSSQAAALVSGAAAYLLAAGVSDTQVPLMLAAASWGMSGTLYYSEGLGAGPVHVGQTIWSACKGNISSQDPDRVRVAMLPYMVDLGDDMTAPRARLMVMEADGSPLRDFEAWLTVSGSTAATLSCVTDGDGFCQVTGEAASARDADGSARALAWSLSVDTVVDVTQWYAYHPTSAAFASDALEILLTAIQDAEQDDALIAISWQDTADAELGEVAAGYSVLNSGTGLASAPLGVVFSPEALPDAEVSVVDVDLDGTGLASAPLGSATLTRLDFSGVGLSSSPLGVQSFSLLAYSGTGLASAPLGLSALTTFEGSSAYDAETLSMDGELIDFSTGTVSGATGESTTGDILTSGGWIGGQGSYPATSLLLGSESIAITPEAAVTPSGMGAEAL